MKKFLAILLAALMVLANVAALAEVLVPEIPEITLEPDPVFNAPVEGNANVPYVVMTKSYGQDAISEELSFTVAFESGPDGADTPIVYVGDDADDTDNKVTMDGSSKQFYIRVADFAQSLPVGVYKWTVTEQAGETAGVTYSATEQPITFEMYVTYVVDANGVPTTEKEFRLVAYATKEGAKEDTITNSVDFTDEDSDGVGFKVTKEVSGDLADTEMPFDITVTFTNTNAVYTDIEVIGGNADNIDTEEGITTTAITGNGWTTKVIKLHLKHGETVSFGNIIAGTSYTVVETGINRIDGDESHADYMYDSSDVVDFVNSINDVYAYTVDGEVTTATALPNANTTLTEAPKATVTNTKNIGDDVPDTGITLETVPYVLIAVITVAAAMMLVARKREEY